ncbi:amidase [Arthrobacter sp. StoSoilB3]|jgi:amidase|uniref:amidase n=1 Tax=Paenarthrobacter TaxID=1742992 RepID=UPI001666AA27|nr:amidase [Paenarthrobacter nicotinovorans]BCW38500.1 amidase [Arthrobacter sp. StoSoilB3]MBP2394533.1 amidase [Paenarthrobacter nicotinovorans]UKE99281.1 amidase [Paenarthrobacter nicotinovorans]UKF04062.1 amidase [Paenarthrobacter nicotinovorans]GGV40016.1 amidase [Paenarthrobacter nicotinovorans]
MSSLHELSARAQAALIKSGNLTSIALTEHYLARISRLDGRLGAYVRVTDELALRQAAAADHLIRSQGTDAVGPLHGVPVAIKDNIDVEDVPTGWGIAERTEGAVGDDHLVGLLRAAHQPILGKTHLPEFALSCHAENHIGGDTRNPWSEKHTPGGSSGGSAAAVSAGLAPLALGTDAGGSVRIPASCCGLVGVRPSNGTVSGNPGDPAVTGLSVPGVLARDAGDAAALLAVIAGQAPGDLSAARTWQGQVGQLRIGLSVRPMVPGLEPAPVCVRAAQDLASDLARMGHEVVPVELGEDNVVAQAFRDTWSVVAASYEVDDESSLGAFTRMMREQGRAVTGVQLHESLALFRGVALMLEEFVFGGVDFLVTPTLATPPPLRGAFTTSANEEESFAAMSRFMPYTPMYNIAGMPAVSVPVSKADGLPIGAMIGGRHGSEGRLLLEVDRILGDRGALGLAPGWA